MKVPARSGNVKRQLTTLGRRILGGLALVAALVLPKSVHASFRKHPSPTFSERAAKVKTALEQTVPSTHHSHSSPKPMQWYNWGNWNNWPNWHNWNNWNNWRNWIKW